MDLKTILFFAILVMLLPYELKAQYTDPGSMGFIFQFLLIIFAFIIFYFQKIRFIIIRIWNKLFGKDLPK